jgi:protein SCO1/2
MTVHEPNFDIEFELVDHRGWSVNRRTYRGRHILAFFGFTNCQLICPRALGKLSEVLDGLGPLADRIDALYITVDPERDTPETMSNFLRSYPRFTGLTGSRQQIDKLKRAFRVYAERRPSVKDGAEYTVPHTAITYVMAPDGRLLTHFSDVAPVGEMISRLQGVLDAAAGP